MVDIGTVRSLWRYPVKSMAGDQFTSLPVDEWGVVGDRGWALRDGVRGGIRGAKKIPGLMRLHARYLDEPTPDARSPHVEITSPEGERVRSDDAHAHDRLSQLLDHAVTLCALAPASDFEHYRRGAPDTEDTDSELRAMFGREPDEPLPSFEGLPLDVLMEYESPPGTYFDALPILLVSSRTLGRLASLTSGADADVRRFRPNLVVEVGDEVPEEFPELTWLGKSVQVGDVELEITAACPRCVMVTHPQADIGRNRELLRTIVKHADQMVGVYAKVIRPGTFESGAPLTVR